ncbi:MAG: c-type cytochrome [Deltaproteobacteria bacterium]|jgi:cytochrome c oxidase cbb3-type subunit 3|nr:c-type cytochrome [Deltaproteobacteria bacterium]MBW2383639.1 c-type cytochrome [Deltaproteobacteria bacterium]MBW2696354.1 c-type cytochrome [Deltaproteobacteria bacterium]
MSTNRVGLCILLICLGAADSTQTQAAEDVVKGEVLYEQLCQACHGQYGRGDGPVAGDLTTRPPDLTNSALMADRSDDDIVANLIRTGTDTHTPMVMARVVKEESLRNALAYMRTLSVPGKHVSVRAGQDLYQTFCWICHGEKGDGQGPAAARLPGNKPRDFTSSDFVIEGRENEIYEIVRTGAASSIHGSDYMLEWGTKLSPQQMKDLVEYLKTFQRPGAVE